MNAYDRQNFRSEVIGSLLRPEYPKRVVQQHEGGQISDAALRSVEDTPYWRRSCCRRSAIST
ncbi:MAG: hypothetical protein C4290_06805 [Chloroflexota bacterium]